MKTVISHATKKEMQKFDEDNWRWMDIEHYGNEVEWNIKEQLFKATIEHKLVGICKLKLEAGVVFIDQITIDKNHHRQGIGRQLMSYIEKF